MRSSSFLQLHRFASRRLGPSSSCYSSTVSATVIQQRQQPQPQPQQQRRSIVSSRLTTTTVNDDSAFSNRPKPEDLTFGTTFTDHMLTIEWKDGAWQDPCIQPFSDLQIHPAASGLHYGLQCFEGMKAYRTSSEDDQKVRLFRPDKNMQRLASSMERLNLPGADFDHTQLLDCIQQLVRLDKRWIPTEPDYSLYIRPTVVATHPFLGLAAPKQLLLYVLLSPVGPYYKDGTFAPVRLVTSSTVRAWPGGTGHVKVGGNYAPTMQAQAVASAAGYDQVLWLHDDDVVTEVGSMNVFFVLEEEQDDNDGVTTELLTPPLQSELILPGVTRDSILQLARQQYHDVKVTERFPTLTELHTASNQGRLREVFGAGTAAVVSPVSSIHHRDEKKNIVINVTAAPGPLTERLRNDITGIQRGTLQGPVGWSVVI